MQAVYALMSVALSLYFPHTLFSIHYVTEIAAPVKVSKPAVATLLPIIS